MENQKTWLEVSLNGPWGRSQQPRHSGRGEARSSSRASPARRPARPSFTFMPTTRRPADRRRIANCTQRIIEGIRGRVDAIVYPTIPARGPAWAILAGQTRAAALRPHRGAGRSAACSSGRRSIQARSTSPTTTICARTSRGSSTEPRRAHPSRRWTWLGSYRFHPAYAIYEPGFLRLGATLHWRCSCPAPIYRFMFSSGYTFGFPPDDYGLTAYLNLLDQVAPGAQWMIGGLAVDVSAHDPARGPEGGHVRVGLEDAPLGSERTNLQWVEAATQGHRRRRRRTGHGGGCARRAEGARDGRRVGCAGARM